MTVRGPERVATDAAPPAHAAGPADAHMQDALARMVPGQHVTVLCDGIAEQLDVMVGYTAAGLERGERCVCVLHDQRPKDLVDRLKDAGFAAAELIASGQLELADAARTYVPDGHFDPERTIDVLRAMVRGAESDGYPAVRLAGEMSWSLESAPGADRLLEYEAALNEFYPRSRAIGLCVYDRTRFPAATLRGVLATHPYVLTRGVLAENPFYVSPRPAAGPTFELDEVDRMLAELADRQADRDRLAIVEGRYADLFENAVEGIFEARLGGGLIAVNVACARLCGFDSPEELLAGAGTGSWEWLDPPQREELTTRLRASGAVAEYECQLRRRGAPPVWVSLSARLASRPGEREPVIEGVVIDISGRRAAERALRTSREEYRALFEHLVEGAAHGRVVFDEGGHATDWIFLDANDAFASATGLGDVVGRLASDVFPDLRTSHADLLEACGRVTRSGVPEGLEVYLAPVERWLAVKVFRPAPDRFAAIFDDVTERREAEDVLRRSEARYRSTLDSMLEGCMIIDRDWRYLYVNDAAARHGHGERSALEGRTMPEMYPGIEESEIFGRYRRCMEDRVAQRFESSFTFADGSSGWYEFSVEPVPEGIFVLSVEITERKRAEAEVQALNAELEERVARRTAELEAANRELEAFGYSVSHDLRAPLRAIDAFSRILDDEHAAHLDAEGRRALGVIRRNATRMRLLIDDLVAFSLVGRREFERRGVDMAALARSVADELRAADPARPVDIDIGDLASASGDRTALRQVWENLLSNAVKFSRQVAGPRVEIRCEEHDGELRYTVRDNGVGFDPALAGRLWNPFQRLHPQAEFEGTGIGLAIVARVVGRHGGRVWAEGSPGAGATFGFALPARAREEP